MIRWLLVLRHLVNILMHILIHDVIDLLFNFVIFLKGIYTVNTLYMYILFCVACIADVFFFFFVRFFEFNFSKHALG